MNLDDCAIGRYCSVKCLIHSCFHFYVMTRTKRGSSQWTPLRLPAIHIISTHCTSNYMQECARMIFTWPKERASLFLNLKANSRSWEEEIKTDRLWSMRYLSCRFLKNQEHPFCLFCLASLLSNKAGACSFLSLAVLLPQNKMNAMVRHTGGKH